MSWGIGIEGMKLQANFVREALAPLDSLNPGSPGSVPAGVHLGSVHLIGGGGRPGSAAMITPPDASVAGAKEISEGLRPGVRKNRQIP